MRALVAMVAGKFSGPMSFEPGLAALRKSGLDYASMQGLTFQQYAQRADAEYR